MSGRLLFFAAFLVVLVGSGHQVTADFPLCLVHTGNTLGQILPVNAYADPCSPGADSKCFGGMARRQTIIKQARAACENILVLDGGDFLSGSLFLFQFGPYASAYYLNQLGYQAVGLSTRDFIEKIDVLVEFLKNSSIPAVCANLNIKNEPRYTGLIFPYKVFNISGTLVGYTSEIAPTLAITTDNPGNVTLELSQPAIQRVVGEMLDNDVEIIIVALTSIVLGDVTTLMDTVYGIDYIIYEPLYQINGTGPALPFIHTTPWGSQVVVTGDGYSGERVAWVNMTFNGKGQLSDMNGQVILLTNAITDDPDIENDLVAQEAIIKAAYSEVVGSSTSYGPYVPGFCGYQECGIGDYHSDALRRYQNSDMAITNGGAFGAPLPAGDITLGNVTAAFPFDDSDTLSIVPVTGAILWLALENGVSRSQNASVFAGRFPQISGFAFQWNPTQPVGSRIVNVWSVSASGAKTYIPQNSKKIFTVAINSFMRVGGDGYVVFKNNVSGTAIDGLPFLQKIALDDLETHSPVTFPAITATNWRIQTTSALKANIYAPYYDDYFVDWDSAHAIVLIVLSVITALFLFLLLITVIVLWIVKDPSIRGTKLMFNVVQICSMIVACFIIFIFIGEPNDAYCAVRPWTSLLFTLVFGNLMAKQISITIQSIEAIVKKESDEIMQVKYKMFLLLRNLIPFVVVHVVFLILWTSIDHPKEGQEDASGDINSQLTCRSTNELGFLIVLFLGFLLEMVIGVVCSLWLFHVPVMFGEAKSLGWAIYLSSGITVIVVVMFNALRNYPVVVFYILGFGILLALYAIALMLYAPVLYYLVRRVLRDKGDVTVDVGDIIAPEDKAVKVEDELDHL
eukprot:TRINITY_DN4360_c0_g1_i2.p1 TRINITY_DN4360_c0_g1~~TRINITY_DN4360_c0_g1_i2.p1  ORF type:complete len:851 (-),score=84.01 TRINITY_DN4360_c0_g1_i2:131-2683(-)